MKLPNNLPWWARHVVNLAVLACVLWSMESNDAPGWAYALVFYLATKPSTIDHGLDIAALQTTIKKRLPHPDDLDEIEPKENE